MRAEHLPCSRRRLLVCLVGLLLLLSARTTQLSAQPATDPAGSSRGPRVLVLTHALDPEAERTFREIVTLSLTLALERRGAQPVHESRPATSPPLSGEPAAVLAAAAAPAADHVLLADYRTAEADLEVQLSWYERGREAPIAQVSRRGRRDLALDRVIVEAAEELLRAANPALANATPAPVAAPPTAGSPPAAPPAAPTAPLPPGEAPPPEAPEAPDASEARPKRVDIGLGVAPFVTTGAASEYFKLGVVPVLNAVFLFRGEQQRFGVGVYAGANLFSAEGSIETASAYLVPVGLALRYELGKPSAPLIVFGLSGGPALIGLTTSGGEQNAGLTFFGRGSLGIRLPIGKVFGIAAEAGYDLYWEQPYPIMGFCPAVYTSIRL